MRKSARRNSDNATKDTSSGIDRISNLPAPLLSHILSLLPTECAVATSVLSTRWRFLWTSITNLHFNGTGSNPKKALNLRKNGFTQFVNRVLLLLNPPSIHKFRLKCGQEICDPFYLNSWICAAIGRTVGVLDLFLTNFEQPMELPLTQIYCNVAVLKLEGDIRFKIPVQASVCFPSLQTLVLSRIAFEIASNSSISFPNLKRLHLKHVQYKNEDSVHKLFSNCPVLDRLVIKRSSCDNVLCLIIRIPSLTKLTLEFRFRNYDDHKYKLHMDTPALQHLNLKEHSTCEYLTAVNLSSLLQANVELGFIYKRDAERCISFSKFVERLSKVRFLSVSGDALKAINIAPGFHNLTRLELGRYYCIDLSVLFKNLLESMDNLEHLIVKGWSSSCSDHSWWTEPLNVPKCLLLRVRNISFNMSDECSCCDELEMLRYFLKNAEVLQLLTISTDDCLDPTEKLELVQKISMFPRGSRTCQVAFLL